MSFQEECNKIILEFKDKNLFYDLEPILEERDEFITEDILIYIISRYKEKTSGEILNYVKNRLSNNNKSYAYTLIHETLNGKNQIYPSELKRSNIPINLYKYIINNPIYYLKNPLNYNLLRNLIPVNKIGYIYNNIKNECKKSITNKIFNNILTVKILFIFDIKIKECFYYFNTILYKNFINYKKKRDILLKRFNRGISDIIESYNLRPLYIIKITQKMYKLLDIIINRIVNNFKLDYNFNLIMYIIQKYFEYRIIYFNETKLFNTINYIEIKKYIY